jgi:hypothetical protein
MRTSSSGNKKAVRLDFNQTNAKRRRQIKALNIKIDRISEVIKRAEIVEAKRWREDRGNCRDDECCLMEEVSMT